MDRNDVMERLNLDAGKPVVTFCMGTDQDLAKQISRVLADYAGVQFVIACYRNQAIFDIFRNTVANGPSSGSSIFGELARVSVLLRFTLYQAGTCNRL